MGRRAMGHRPNHWNVTRRIKLKDLIRRRYRGDPTIPTHHTPAKQLVPPTALRAGRTSHPTVIVQWAVRPHPLGS